MKFGHKCTATKRWFAWYPIELPNGLYAWLEYVYRTKHCRSTGGYFWTYSLDKER